LARNRTKLTDEIKLELLDYIDEIKKNGEKRLPSEEKLSKKFMVSRATIRTVLSDLENEGIVNRKHGVGTFINELSMPFHVQFSPVSLYTDMIKEFGYKSKSKHIGKPEILENVDKKIYKKLKISEDEKIVFTKKIFYADENPCVLCVDYFPLSIVEKDNLLSKIDDYDDSLFDFFNYELNRKIVADQAEITTTTSDETKILSEYFPKIAKSFLQLNCINFDRDNIPVLYAEEYVDTNLIRFFSMRKK